MTILKRRTIVLAAGAALLALSLGAIPAGATDRDERKKDSGNERCEGCHDGTEKGHIRTVEPGHCCIRGRAKDKPGTSVTMTAVGPVTKSVTFVTGRNWRGEGVITGLKDGRYIVTITGKRKSRTVTVTGCPKEERPTPTTTPTPTTQPTPTTAPPDDEDETETTSTNQGRTPPSAPAPSTPAEAAPPADAAPPSQTMNALPFTDNNRNIVLGGFGAALLALGTLFLATTRRRPARIDRSS